MALTWTAKAAGDTARREWKPPLRPDDSLSSCSASASGVTVSDSEIDGDTALFTLTAGTNGTTATVTLTAVTTAGDTFTETAYIAIRSTATLRTVTVRDVCAFALRKITGDGDDASSEQEARAIEYLEELLAHWRLSGRDVGLSGTMSVSDTLTIPDAYFPAIKYGLRLQLHSHYGAEIGPFDVQMAEQAERALTNVLVSFDDVTLSPTLANTTWPVASLF